MPASIRHISRASIALSAFALIVTLSAAPASHAQQVVVFEIAIVAGREDIGSGPQWFFFIEVLGAGLSTGSVDPPAGGTSGPFMLVDDPGFGLELEFEAGPFSTFSALQAAHPAGNYAFTLPGNETVTLAWNPTEPVGASGGQPTLVINSPADGATGVSSEPEIVYTFDCTNCKDLNLEIEDSFTGGFIASVGFGQLNVAGGAFANPIPYSSMITSGEAFPPPIAQLPDGGVQAELLIGLATFSDESFDLPSNLLVPDFEYVDASIVFAESAFTVPEPSAELSALAALGVVALLRCRRRRPVEARIGFCTILAPLDILFSTGGIGRRSFFVLPTVGYQNASAALVDASVRPTAILRCFLAHVAMVKATDTR